MPPSPLPADAVDAALLLYLLDRHPAPVHLDDIARTFSGDDWHSSLASLVADGVLHREGSLFLATAAAVRTSRLLG